MSKGTYEGDFDEIKFVKLFNSNKIPFTTYINNFGEPSHLWMVRVTTKQLSSLSNQKVFTRSDCYLVYIESDISNLLKENSYLLDEDILINNNISFRKIPFSGISVKMTSSKSYQILKVGPNSFRSLFGCFELGAGASLFCLRPEELSKNESLIFGWKTSPTLMSDYFKDFTLGNKNFFLDQEVCKKIKTFSCKEIETLIKTSISLQKKVFNGETLYEEPYTAWFFYHGTSIDSLTFIPFSVTTGSGRSHGDYTIVLKPLNH